MKKICFINGSPRENNSASQYFIDELLGIIDDNSYEINQLKVNKEVDYEKIVNVDVLIIVFPLYVDSLPSTMIAFLENLENYAKTSENSPRVYTIINCGFFEGIQTINAVQIIKNFCHKVGYKWRLGVGLGAGEFLKETKEIIPLNGKIKAEIYQAFLEIKNDIHNSLEDEVENIFLSPDFPKDDFVSSAEQHWFNIANTKAVSKNQIYAKPFVEKVK